MMNLGKFSFLLTISLLFLFGHSYAQNQDETPNRLSIGLFGTLTQGHLNLGSTFQSGINANFEFEEQFNTTLGFNIRYVATPEVALQTNISFGNFTLLSEFQNQQTVLSLENQYLTSSLSTQLSLLRLFGSNSREFNIYGTIGAGLMFNDVSVESDNFEINVSPSDHPFQTFFTSIGGGIRFNLGPRIDSFAQYEYNVGNRDIIDGDFLGELFELNGSAKTTNTWSVVSFGIQFKFGSSSVDADWPTPLLPPGQSPYVDDDVLFEELESRLLARQEEEFNEQISQLNSRIDSLNTELASQLVIESTSEATHSDTVKVLLARIESLEQEIANEKEKSEQNELKIDALTNQLESLQADLTKQQQAHREQQELSKNNVTNLQNRINSLENELRQIQGGEQIGQTIIDDTTKETDSETDPAVDDTSTPAERREDSEPETVGRKDVESSSEIADTLAAEEQQTTELPEGEDETEDDTGKLADEPEIVSKEPEETTESSVVDTKNDTTSIAVESEPDETETDEAATDEESRSVLWLIYILIALIVAAVIYFVSKPFASKDDDNQSGSSDDSNKGGRSPSPTSTAPDGGSKTVKPSDESSTTYPVPEHSRNVERKKSNSKSSSNKNVSKSASTPTASEAIPEHSITLDSKSKRSKSDNASSDSISHEYSRNESVKSSEDRIDFPSIGFISMAKNEISDYFGNLFSKQSRDK